MASIRQVAVTLFGVLLLSCRARPNGERDVVDESTTRASGVVGSNPTQFASTARSLAVTLIDSIQYANELDEGVLRRVEVKVNGSLDTLPNVLTRLPVVTSGDSVAYGFLFKTTGEIAGIFRYHTDNRRVETLPLPSDMSPWVSEPAFAPNARFVAYVRFDSSAVAKAIIRNWPALSVVSESPAIRTVAGDALGGGIKWTSSEEALFFIGPVDDASNRWARLRFHVSNRRLIVDTIAMPNATP